MINIHLQPNNFNSKRSFFDLNDCHINDLWALRARSLVIMRAPVIVVAILMIFGWKRTVPSYSHLHIKISRWEKGRSPCLIHHKSWGSLLNK